MLFPKNPQRARNIKLKRKLRQRREKANEPILLLKCKKKRINMIDNLKK